jgi:serine/threonine-protein kinase
MPARPEDLVGRQLGSFRLKQLLGLGGMGAVYLGEHRVIGSRVAVKVLHPHLASQPTLVKRFYTEARAVNLVGHENILRIYDLCSEDGLHYLIMEHLEGRELAHLTGAPLEARVAIPILMQICDALAAAHAHGVVHRDLKPQNIFLVERPGRPPFVKLLDFGIAKLLQDASAAQTGLGLIVGTPQYMAPEQFISSAVDARSDLYSLGVISYQLATGRLPFDSASLAGLMLSHRGSIPTPPRELEPGVPDAWSRCTMRALAKQPEDRYQDALALRRDLEEALAMLTSTAREAPGPTFTADVYGAGGQKLCTAQCAGLFKSGAVLAAESFSPPLFSTLRVSLRVPGGCLELTCEVVRHVSPAQAAAWGMPAGVGVQFVRLTAEQKAALERLLRGEALPATPAPVGDGAEVGRLLEALQGRAVRAGGDHYAFLGLTPDAEPSEIRARGRELRAALDRCRLQAPSAAQQAALDALEERIARAVQILGHTERRAEYDASRGNFYGVARAISAGLTVSELERIRKRFLADHPRAEGRAQVQATCGRVYEDHHDLLRAKDAYEQALKVDPLDLTLHQRYWPLRRRISATPELRAAP